MLTHMYLAVCFLSELTMAAQQPQPMIIMANTFPKGYNVEIGKKNKRVEFHKIKCSEPSCQIAIEVLKIHKCRHVMEKSASVPEIYIHQLWHTLLPSLEEKSFTCTLDRRKVTVDIDLLRSVLLLPEAPAPAKQFHPAPSKETVLNFLLEIGYDEQENEPLTYVSKVDDKYIPNLGGNLISSLLDPSPGEKAGMSILDYFIYKSSGKSST